MLNRDLLLYAINISLHHVEFSGAFLKLIIIYVVTESLHIGKSETWEKTTETAFHKCSGNWCSVKLNKIHRKVSVPESHLNIVAGLQHATLLRKRTRHRCFPFITLHTFKLVVLERFSWPFSQSLWKILGHNTSYTCAIISYS